MKYDGAKNLFKKLTPNAFKSVSNILAIKQNFIRQRFKGIRSHDNILGVMITYYHNDDYSSNFFKLGSPDFDLDNTYDMMMMMIMIIALTPTKLSSIELDYTSI